MPSSQLEAHGHLGAYPLTTPSALAVDLHSQNLLDFDTVLRDLGLVRNGKTGAAALPATVAGQADFHGSWTGSLVDPHLVGTAKATQLAVEIPAASTGKNPPAPAQVIRWDSAEASGSYSAAKIVIDRGQLRRGPAEIDLDGTFVPTSLTQAPGEGPVPVYDANSVLRLHLRASKVGLDELLPLTGQNLPVTGLLNAQFDASGPMRALAGSGWVELDGGSVFGEPVARIRAQGQIANQTVKLTSITVTRAPARSPLPAAMS